MTQCLKSKATKLRYRFLRVDEQWRQCYQLMIHLENRPSLRKRSEIFKNRKRVGCGKPSPKNLIFRFSLRLCRKSARQTIHRQRLFCHSTIQVQGVSSKSYFNRDVAYFFFTPKLALGSAKLQLCWHLGLSHPNKASFKRRGRIEDVFVLRRLTVHVWGNPKMCIYQFTYQKTLMTFSLPWPEICNKTGNSWSVKWIRDNWNDPKRDTTASPSNYAKGFK